MKISRKKALAILAVAIFVGFFVWGRTADAAEARLGLGIGYSSIEYVLYFTKPSCHC